MTRLPFVFALVAVLCIPYEVGFYQTAFIKEILHKIYVTAIAVGIVWMMARYAVRSERPQLKAMFADFVQALFLTLLLGNSLDWWTLGWLSRPEWLYLGVILIFIREFSALRIDLKRQYLNPAQLFIASFFFIILIGTLLLLLPKATVADLSLLDAFFTSTSAVCVTGLIVVDTATFFTPLGHVILLLLIQVGGIGIMTFTSYFSYFFRGAASYETQLQLRDMTNTEKIAEVFNTLKRIIVLTVTIEAVGTAAIYFSVNAGHFSSMQDRLFFSIFHSVSSFCNAGFSTYTLGLYDPMLRYNYGFLSIISFLFIIGGIGFPIAFNFIRYIRYRLINLFSRSQRKTQPWIINLNTRIAVITTLILIGTGTFLFYVFEYNNTLEEHSFWGKMVASFFNATTPRTAGFNMVDMATLKFHTVMMIFFLMWVGGSPLSTAGGIKTSTLAVATLNILSLARGLDRIEVFRREIAYNSVRRASATISLSLIVIGGAVFLLSISDPDQNLIYLAFESFSAYSTVGLSLGITPALSPFGKLVIIGTMFIGRVSMLTILIAFFRRVKHLQYRYPGEDIIIN